MNEVEDEPQQKPQKHRFYNKGKANVFTIAGRVMPGDSALLTTAEAKQHDTLTRMKP